MRLLLVFDSLKGSLTALQACQSLKEGLESSRLKCEIEMLPMADGGEGTLDCLHEARSGVWVTRPYAVAAGYEKSCRWLRFGSNEAAMEVAQTVGITDLQKQSPSVMSRHSGASGMMLRHIIESGCRSISIGLGGSCTTDGGLGLLVALGLQCYDQNEQLVEPYPSNFAKITRLKWQPLFKFDELQLNLLNDVENSLCGANGACVVYGPQKGLAKEHIQPLDDNINRIYALLEKLLDKSLIKQVGAGAAGGLGAALFALGAVAKSGAEVLIELTQLEQKISNSELVITGEGRSDAQTLAGKLPKRVADLARKMKRPVLLVSGGIDRDSHVQLCEYFDGVYSISNGPNDLATAMVQAPTLLKNFGLSIGHTLAALRD